MTNTNDTFDLDAMGAADFFEPGKTYVLADPYKAPELLDVYSTALTPGNRARGWDEQKEA